MSNIGEPEVWLYEDTYYQYVSDYAQCDPNAVKYIRDETHQELVDAAYERGVTAGFDEAIHEVKRGEIDPQTFKRGGDHD